jgi:uncharacterized membrane protein
MENNPAGKTALGLDNNVGALICYVGNIICALGLIYSIIVVVTDKTNKLPRFHAFQSILLSVSCFVIAIVLNILTAILIGGASATGSGAAAAGSMGLVSIIYLIFGLGVLVAIIFCAIKAFQGQIFKLPIIGNLADQWSN